MKDDFNMERRLMLAFLLSGLLLLLLVPLINRHAQPASPAPSAPAARPLPHAAAGAAAPAQPSAHARPLTPAAKPAPAETIVSQAARHYSVTTPVYRIEFSNRGASVRSWVLTRYTDQQLHPLDLVNPRFAARHGYPFQFEVPGHPALTGKLAGALFHTVLTRLPNGHTRLDFTWAQNGWFAEKILDFGRGYQLRARAVVRRQGRPVLAGLLWPGAFADSSLENSHITERIFVRDGGLKKWDPSQVANHSTYAADLQFAGLENKYFALAFFPPAHQPLRLTRLKTLYHPVLWKSGRPQTAPKPVNTLGLGVAAAGWLRVFVGPKRLQLLHRVAPHLSAIVHFGWFGFAAKPLFLWMRWTYNHWIHNYGWVILFVTFVITMIMFPFRLTAQKTQVKMIALQPRIKALNDKMRKLPLKDPKRQQMQQEMMKMYQEEGVNPLGGCLPMLIPLPLIYAFYEVLETSIELRHAPFLGYLHDLSARDPYFILPLLLVASQFWFMSMVPMMAGTDPMQAKIMRYGMPLFMGYIFFLMPSGVDLYYLGSNLINVGQQYVINRRYAPVKPAAPAAKGKKALARKK